MGRMEHETSLGIEGGVTITTGRRVKHIALWQYL